MSSPTTTVQRVHFEDFDGSQFERLVFAYHVRTDRWRSIEWQGQSGKDKGRDIWGVRDNDTKSGESICILCANWGILTSTKPASDMNKLLLAQTGKPDRIRVVSRSDISSRVRDKIKKVAKDLDIWACDVWSGAEFEEFLRRDCESLLRRFVGGEQFPDSSQELTDFAREIKATNDKEALALIARVFDRPAFTTPFQNESNIYGFKKAVADTIQAINTGVWQTRDGKELGRLPSKFDFKDHAIRDALGDVVTKLTRLRSTFDTFLKQERIRPCGCSDRDCPVLFIEPDAAYALDAIRREILVDFRRLSPDFNVCMDATLGS